MSLQRGEHAPAVLVVDPDDGQRRHVRALLEELGVTVVEAAGVVEASQAIGLQQVHLHGAVLDGSLPPAGLQELIVEIERRWPLAIVVVEAAGSAIGTTPVAASSVDRNDVRAVVDALMLPVADDWVPADADATGAGIHGLELGDVTETWLELCRWDPMLPPDSTPPPIAPLTGLSNRRALQLDLVREIARADRYGRQFSLMVVDLDGLKQVNDLEGHAAGDDRLRALASALHQVLRVGDAAYRIGGDEFVVLLPETTEERVQFVVQRALEHGAPTFSWGTATYP